MWSGRLYGVFYAALAILPLLSGGREEQRWGAALYFVFLGASILVATEQMKHGSRLAACLLFALFTASKISAWLMQGQPLLSGLLWTVLIAGGLANGIWGTFALAAVQRDARSVPPAPPRERSSP